MAVSLSLVLLILFNSTITTAARNPLSPPPPDPFKAQPSEISFPLTPVTNNTDLKPQHSNNYRSSPPWVIIGLAVRLGLVSTI
ncbi:hypothetical protein A2U01_0054071 [Trifolium medium]|uniref:Uncharacterized protein n=1 Tax=Trifolium medium TaxID=97028 RepID=A0A392R9H2_9FABA|nr:hypothetical protein [Trifolium medium]